MNGKAIETGGALPGETGQCGDRRGERVPNDLIRRARLALRSPSGSGRVLSRQEVAEAVNAWVFAETGRHCSLDGGYVGALERGEVRWPSAHYRAGLRAVLGAKTDADLGLFIIWGAGRSAEEATGAETVSPPEIAPAIDAPPGDANAVDGQATVSTLLHKILVGRHWQSPRTFRTQFLRAARELAEREGDPMMQTLDVSDRQFQRWLAGSARPRPDACRVLEHMFGYPIDRLMSTGEKDLRATFAVTGPADVPANGAVVGLVQPSSAAELRPVRVSVSPGTAVTVVCHDGAPGQVAVLAGSARVLIDTCGVHAASTAPVVAELPSQPGMARVYSIAERRAG